MMYQQIHDLMNDGISSSQIVYVNFEDERLLEIGVDDLNTILELGIEFSGSKGKPYLFLDEIQNVGGCCQNRVGESNKTFVLSHHRASRSAHGGSNSY